MAENQAFQRILELEVTASEGADTLVVTKVKFYRDRQSLNAGKGIEVAATPGAAAANTEVEMGEQGIPFPTIIRLKSTFGA